MEGSRIKMALRYALRLVPLVVIVAGLIWFFFLRSPSQADTPPETPGPETTQSENKGDSTTAEESKSVANAPQAATPATSNTQASQNLPATGPTDSLAIFVLSALAGTLFWKWRLSRR